MKLFTRNRPLRGRAQLQAEAFEMARQAEARGESFHAELRLARLERGLDA